MVITKIPYTTIKRWMREQQISERMDGGGGGEAKGRRNGNVRGSEVVKLRRRRRTQWERIPNHTFRIGYKTVSSREGGLSIGDGRPSNPTPPATDRRIVPHEDTHPEWRWAYSLFTGSQERNRDVPRIDNNYS